MVMSWIGSSQVGSACFSLSWVRTWSVSSSESSKWESFVSFSTLVELCSSTLRFLVEAGGGFLQQIRR